MTDEADAIVVGNGINGLVAAAELARAGWSVILLERNAEIGGFIATEERGANRVLDRVARHAPDLRDKIRAIDILTPDDLRDRNPNAVSGDPYGGSAELDQSFLWRPLASSGRHATSVGRLWHIGASTHPGPGLGGGSGHLVAT